MENRNTNNCCVDGCRNKQKDSKFSFFTLPKDSERRNEWLKEIGRYDLLNRTDIKPNSYKVCSIHFASSVMSEVLTRKLLPGAVPTKFLRNQPQPSTSKCENESCTACDVSTQTEDSYINILSVAKVTSASMSNVETHTFKSAKEQEVQTAQALSTRTPRERKLLTKLQTSEKERRRLEYELDKIKKDTEIKNSLEPSQAGNNTEEITERFNKLIQWQNSGKNKYKEPLNMAEEEARKKKKKSSPKKLGNKKSISESERAKARKRKLKYLANLTEEQKALKRQKDREYFRRRVEKEKRKSIEEMSERERNKKREMWRESSKKYRQNKKTLKKSKSGKDINITEPNESLASITSVNVKNVMEEINEGNNSLLVERPVAREIINGTQVRRDSTLPEVEKEFEVEIEVKKETTDDPLSFDHVQVKTEPAEGEDVGERQEEPRQRFVEVPIKHEPDDSIQIEENDVAATVHLKQEKELDL